MRTVALLSGGAEGSAARDWLSGISGIEVNSCEALRDVDWGRTEVVWVHGASCAPHPGLVPWLQKGGRLLLSLEATRLPHAIGLEPIPPDDHRSTTWRHDEDEFWLAEYRSFRAFPHIRGLAGHGPHPLFHGMDQGTFTWAPTDGEEYSWLVYRSERPAAGRVVAVERSFIHLNPDRAVAWEYGVGEGGILCLGAFIHLTAPDDLLARQLRVLLLNALRGDAIPRGGREEPAACWPGGAADLANEALAAERPEPLGAVWDEWPPSTSPLLIQSVPKENDPWTLAGRRVLVVGNERTGLREVWAHPYRVVREAQLTVEGAAPEVASVHVSPDEVVRVLRSGEVELTERVSTALEHGLVFWSIVADAPVKIRLSWVTDMRRMWPYPASPGKPIVTPRSDEARGTDPVRVAFAAEPGLLEIEPAAGAVVVRGPEAEGTGVAVEARGERILRLVLAGAAHRGELDRTRDALRRRRLRAFRQERILHSRRLDERLASLATPDPSLDQAFGWAKVRLDSFLAETPGVGRSLLAGHAASRPGWGDGRPGYGWYFGRDACWTAFATLAVGDRDLARDALRFLSRTEDVTGKVMHEYTTSGLVHYDAADSTPLYLLLAGRYARWTGDLQTLERHWPAIEAAYRFCLETDRDGDGLIENHRVGHGWIEHGPLGGLHVTLYLAACWLAALQELAPVARAMGKPELADELIGRAARARAAIERRFRAGDRYALGLEADGTPRFHRTAMLAVPLLLGAVPPDGAGEWYDAIAGERFSAPWGVRMIATDDPLFDPAGYHQGAVWPLYTGWVSLAEWRGGRFASGLRHLLANASLAEERAKGAFDEVLHGLERRGAGICPDQAWSAAMVVSPAVEGLWGVEPDALAEAVRVRPWLPDGWAEMSLRRLRVGATTLDLRLRRVRDRTVLRVDRVQGPRIRVEAELRGDRPPERVTVDDELLGGARAVFELAASHEVGFEMT